MPDPVQPADSMLAAGSGPSGLFRLLPAEGRGEVKRAHAGSLHPRIVDDVEVDAAAIVAAQRPVFGAAGDDTEHGELAAAVRAVRAHLPHGRHGFALRNQREHGAADQADASLASRLLP